jgi:hypothetical protein
MQAEMPGRALFAIEILAAERAKEADYVIAVTSRQFAKSF